MDRLYNTDQRGEQSAATRKIGSELNTIKNNRASDPTLRSRVLHVENAVRAQTQARTKAKISPAMLA